MTGAAGPEVRSLRYPVRLDLTNPRSVYAQLYDMVPAGASVLDVGAAAGDLEVLLRSRGCRSTAIEADEADALRAAEVADRIVLGDVESLDLDRELGAERFDVVVLADVLEHLREPGRALARVARFLRPGGFVLASIPNVAHSALRLALLAGRWDYTPTGLLDRTHLRFFTRAGVERLFAEAGLCIADVRPVEIGPFETEIPLAPEDYPPGIVDWITRDRDALAYQFVVKGRPLEPAAAPQAGEIRREGAGPARVTPGDLAEARRRALEQLEVVAAARTLELQRRIWELEHEVRDLRRLAAEGEAAKGELALVKASGSYRLARFLSSVRSAVIRSGRGRHDA